MIKKACAFSIYVLILISAVHVSAQSVYKDRLAHTYSIVARDKVTGEMGVAVQSHWFSVGSIVSWAEAGAGAVSYTHLTLPTN